MFGKTVDAQCDQPFNVAVAFNAMNALVAKKIQETTAKLVKELESEIETGKNDACGGLQRHLNDSKKQGVCLSRCKAVALYYVLTSHAHSQIVQAVNIRTEGGCERCRSKAHGRGGRWGR